MQLRLSGTRNREQYISSSNSVELVFISDDSISELGFYIYYVIGNTLCSLLFKYKTGNLLD